MDITLKSLSLSPSDHECQEGDLASMKNLVYDDGALKPIVAPKQMSILGLTAGLVPDTRFYIHEVDTDSLKDDDHKNYIAIVSSGNTKVVKWCNNTTASSLQWRDIEGLKNFDVNAVTFTGRIMNLIGDEETVWAIWRGSEYQVVRLDDFKYSIKLQSQVWKDDTAGNYFSFKSRLGTDFSGCFVLGGNGIAGTEGCAITSVSTAGLKAFVDGITAAANNVIANDDEIHRNISFGFAAIRMYDGSYIAISDLFMIGPKWNLSKIDLQFRNDADFYLTIVANEYLHKDYISVNFPKLDSLKQLIQSIDIFETPGTIFRKLDKAIKLSSEGGLYPWNNDSYTSHVLTTQITLDTLSEKELHTEIENLSFHKVLSLSPAEIAASIATPVALKSCDETEQAVGLSDFFKANHGAAVASNYNSRLLLGDFVEVLKYTPSQQITYTFNSDWIKSPDVLEWNDTYLDCVADGSTGNYKFRPADIYFKINWADSFGSYHSIVTHAENAQATLPFLMVPWPELVSINIYMKTEDRSGNVIYLYKEDLPLKNSETGIWGYNIQTKDNIVTFLSPYVYKLTNLSAGEWELNSIYTIDTNGTKYNAAATAYTGEAYINRYRNRILVSDADNPFLFRDSAIVSVGNGSVLALAAPTQPISQGQAGQTPLVAFTSEGIYPLFIGNDGSLVATQPGPRDVLINPKSVLPIDDAIVFPTARGLMLYAGSQTKCISDTLRGSVFSGILKHLDDILGDTGQTNKITAYAPLSNLGTFLKNCQLMYNYVDQQIIAFLTSSPKALVYSLRSGAWGATDYDYRSVLNSYPEALAVGFNSGNYYIVDAHNSNPPSSTAFNLITRPFGLGEPDTLKRINTAIVRGYFQKGHVKTALYGSRDLLNWNLINTSVDHYLRNRMGSPYKYFRIVALGNLSADETIHSVSLDVSGSCTNQMR